MMATTTMTTKRSLLVMSIGQKDTMVDTTRSVHDWMEWLVMMHSLGTYEVSHVVDGTKMTVARRRMTTTNEMFHVPNVGYQ